MSPIGHKQDVIAGLRRQMLAVDPQAGRADDTALRSGQGLRLGPGLPRLDQGALHEVIPQDARDHCAALAFALKLLHCAAQGGGVMVWVRTDLHASDHGVPYGIGLAQAGLDLARVLMVCPRQLSDLLWTLEEAARTPGLAGVLGEIPTRLRRYDLTTSRRLHLAAQEAGTPLIVMRPAGTRTPSAARSRWRIAPAPDASPVRDRRHGGPILPGVPRWQAVLERCRDRAPGTWEMEWDHETHCFRLVAALADGPSAPDLVARGTVVSWPERDQRHRVA